MTNQPQQHPSKNQEAKTCYVEAETSNCAGVEAPAVEEKLRIVSTSLNRDCANRTFALEDQLLTLPNSKSRDQDPERGKCHSSIK